MKTKGEEYYYLVDGSGNQITSFGGGTQYAVDDALGTTPTGTLALGIRDDALSTLTPVEGDAIGLRVDSTGRLWTNDPGTVNAVEAIQTAVEGQLDVSAATVTVDLAANNDVQGAAAEGAAVSGNPFLIAGDDGTNVKHVAVAADGAIHIDDGGNSFARNCQHRHQRGEHHDWIEDLLQFAGIRCGRVITQGNETKMSAQLLIAARDLPAQKKGRSRLLGMKLAKIPTVSSGAEQRRRLPISFAPSSDRGNSR